MLLQLFPLFEGTLCDLFGQVDCLFSEAIKLDDDRLTHGEVLQVFLVISEVLEFSFPAQK